MSSTPAPAALDVVVDIPEGPASKYGKLAAAVLAIAALVAAVLNGDHTPETLVALGGAVATLLTYMGGRYAQAAAAIKATGALQAATAPAPARAGIVSVPGDVSPPVVVNVTPAQADSPASEGPPGPDLDDGAHALNDGDPAEPVGGPPIDEAAQAPDPDVVVNVTPAQTEDGAR